MLQRARAGASPLSSYVCTSCRHKLQLNRVLTPSTTISVIRTSRPNFEQKRWITQNWVKQQASFDEAHLAKAKRIEAGEEQSFLSMLEERGLVNQVVGERDQLDKLLNQKRVGVYCGIDPTAPSMHVGHMLPFMVLAWSYVHGYHSVFLLGGSTGRFGDPTGRLAARDKMSSDTRKSNILSLHMQLKKLGSSIEAYGQQYGYEYTKAWRRALENNNTWWNSLSFLDVMKTMGMYMRLGPMLGRETVKNRLEKGDGMALSEFTYPLMQAWDFWVLYQRRGVQVQVGGGDQYGNILAGIEAVKNVIKTREDSPDDAVELTDMNSPIGVTTPLLTTSSGEKFGKSAGNAVWLDKDLTTVFELYQYFLRIPDNDVERILKLLTFIPLPEIAKIMETQNIDPSKRVAQHRLALDFCTLIHGRNEAKKAADEHRSLFQNRGSPDINALRDAANKTPAEGEDWSPSLNDNAPQVNWSNMSKNTVILPKSLVYNQPMNKILWSAGLVSSKGEGHRLITNKGAHVASTADGKGGLSDSISWFPIKTATGSESEKFILDDKLLILRVGKWKVKTVKIVEDEEFKKMGISAPGWDEL